MSPVIETEQEIVIAHGDFRLRVSSLGASLRGLWRIVNGAEIPVVTGYSGKDNKVGGQGDVLIPFPGRVKDGQYTFAGTTYQMPRNDKDGPNAIHGFLRSVLWQVVEETNDSVTFSTDYQPEAGLYPSALQATITYTLSDAGMECRFVIENTGDKSAPVGVGFHPYFTVSEGLIDTDTLHVPMQSILEFNTGLIPTGQVLPVDQTSFDFRTPRSIGTTKFNTCYSNPIPDPDGLTRIRLSSPTQDRVITVWMDETFPYVVLFSGDPLGEPHKRRSLAIEPMTCGSDAFNHPDWGLATLAPGETFTGTWGVSLSE